jgi:hypothetical protein
MNGQYINNIHYVDDTVLIADSVSDLQNILNRVNIHSEKYGLRLNVAKTKYMVVSRNQQIAVDLLVNNQKDMRSEKNTVEEMTSKNALHLCCHHGYPEQ